MKKTDIGRELFGNGLSVPEIATKLGVSQATVYRWKKKDEQKGMSWDRLRLEKTIDDSTFKQKQRAFLTSIFNAFEKDSAKLNELSPDERLEILDKYTNLYYKLMNAAKRAEPEVAMAEIITKTVQVIGDIAAEKGREDIVGFLLDELEEIKARICS